MMASSSTSSSRAMPTGMSSCTARTLMRIVNSRLSEFEFFSTCCELNEPTMPADSELYVPVLLPLRPYSVVEFTVDNSVLVIFALNSMSHDAICGSIIAQAQNKAKQSNMQYHTAGTTAATLRSATRGNQLYSASNVCTTTQRQSQSHTHAHAHTDRYTHTIRTTHTRTIKLVSAQNKQKQKQQQQQQHTQTHEHTPPHHTQHTHTHTQC